MPRASGTLSSSKCDKYIEYINAGRDEITQIVNGCSSIVQFYDINVDDFVKWNPSLKRDNCKLSKGYSYCVSLKNAGSTTLSTSTTESSSTNTAVASEFQTTADEPDPTSTEPTPTSTGVETPTPTQSGIDSNCTKFYKVVKDDGCYAIAIHNGITPADFHQYNPAVKNDCSELWPDHYVCVGVTNGA
ncbi:unnamed protein product [Penicillium manginii]